MKGLCWIPQLLQSLQGKLGKPECSEMKGLHPLIGWQCNAKSQKITEGKKQLNAPKDQKQLESFEYHAVEERWDPLTQPRKVKQKPKAYKDSMRPVNQRLVAPAGSSRKKSGRKQDICYWRLKPDYRRKWGRERNLAQRHCPALRSGRATIYAVTAQFIPDRPKRNHFETKQIRWIISTLSPNALWIKELGPWELTL